MNAKQQIAEALILMPLMSVINADHRNGIFVNIDRDKVINKVDEYTSTWIYARKNNLPSFFNLFFRGINKDGCIIIDNFCNIEEDDSGTGDRGECEMVFNVKNYKSPAIVELHDL